MPYGDTLSLASADKSRVEDDGGYGVILAGTFKDAPAAVHLVNDFTAQAYPCYGGRSGHGYAPHPLTPDTLSLATPVVPPGWYRFEVTQGVSSVNSAAAPVPFHLEVVRRQWRSRVFSLRGVFPPWYRFGARNLDGVDLLTSPAEPVEEATVIADISSQVTGSATSFTTPAPFAAGTLRVFLDGVLQNFVVASPTRVVVVDNVTGEFTLSTPPYVGQQLVVEYVPL